MVLTNFLVSVIVVNYLLYVMNSVFVTSPGIIFIPDWWVYDPKTLYWVYIFSIQVS